MSLSPSLSLSLSLPLSLCGLYVVLPGFHSPHPSPLRRPCFAIQGLPSPPDWRLVTVVFQMMAFLAPFEKNVGLVARLDGGISTVTALLQHDDIPCDALTPALKLLRLYVKTSDNNVGLLVRSGGMGTLFRLLQAHRSNVQVVTAVIHVMAECASNGLSQRRVVRVFPSLQLTCNVPLARRGRVHDVGRPWHRRQRLVVVCRVPRPGVGDGVSGLVAELVKPTWVCCVPAGRVRVGTHCVYDWLAQRPTAGCCGKRAAFRCCGARLPALSWPPPSSRP